MLILYNIEGFLNMSEGKINLNKILNNSDVNVVIFVYSYWVEYIFIFI